MGRPFGISDREIDVWMPLNVDESSSEESITGLEILPPPEVNRRTSLASFLKTIELRRIESEIQQTIYRVDSTVAVEDSLVDHFLGRLAQWKDSIPHGARHVKDSGHEPFDGYDYYVSFLRHALVGALN